MHQISYQGWGGRIISSSFSTLHEYMLPAMKLSSSSTTAGVAFPASWPSTQTSFFYWPMECGLGGPISEAIYPIFLLALLHLCCHQEESPLGSCCPGLSPGKNAPRADHSPHCSQMPQPPRKVSQIIYRFNAI